MGRSKVGGTECAQWCAANSFYPDFTYDQSFGIFDTCETCLVNQQKRFPGAPERKLSGYVSGGAET